MTTTPVHPTTSTPEREAPAMSTTYATVVPAARSTARPTGPSFPALTGLEIR